MKRTIGFGVLVFLCCWALTGCESLQKKFTRKKKTKDNQEVMVITPRDYSAHPFPNDVLYKQYFVYWKSWNQELVTSLNDFDSHKKIVGCLEQSLLNLNKMRSYLVPEKAAALDVYVTKTQALKSAVEKTSSMVPSQANGYRYTAERILSSVNREFDAKKMAPYIKADETPAASGESVS
jgi:hypothetical protein